MYVFVCVHVDTVPVETREPDVTMTDQEPKEPDVDLCYNENVDDTCPLKSFDA